MSKDTMDWLDELEMLHRNATPEPWRRYQTGVGALVCAVAAGRNHTLYADPVGGTFPSADLSLILEMRNALPRLLAIARAVEKVNKRWCTGEIDSEVQALVALNSICATFEGISEES